MLKITSLTPEQEQKMIEYRDRVLNKVFNYELKNPDSRETERLMKELYKMCGLSEPEVLIVDSPLACQIAANTHGKKSTPKKLDYFEFGGYINSGDLGWLTFYSFFNKEVGLIPEFAEKIEFLIKCCESSFIQIQLDGMCIVSKYPTFISRNSNNDLHNTSKAAIQFADGYGQHYVNGRFIEPEIFEDSQTLEGAKKQFFATDNEDIKACVITIVKENFGNQGVLDMLGAVEVDSKDVVHANGYIETIKLFKTKEKFSFLQNSKGELNQPYAWIQMVCPSTGNTYLIDTCPSFKDAVECAKWHRPETVPSSIPYVWQSAN